MSIIDKLRLHVGLPQGTWNEKGPVLFFNEVEKWEIQCFREQFKSSEWIQVTMIQWYNEKDTPNVSFFSDEVIDNMLKTWVKEFSSHRLCFLFDDIDIKTSLQREIRYCNPEYNQSIEELDLSIRSYRILSRDGYRKIGDLQFVTDTYIENAPLLGRKASNEIREKQRELEFRR